MEDRVPLIFWNCWDALHTLKFQVFFTPCKRDMTEYILMIFPTLHEVRSRKGGMYNGHFEHPPNAPH